MEVVDLVNEGNGLGFGIKGGKSTGVVVKTVVEGGIADKDGRLKSGDILLHVGEWSVRGMNSEKVARVLRKAGTHVRLVVARPIEEISQETQNPPYSVVIPNESLENHLQELYRIGLTENIEFDQESDAGTHMDEVFFDVNLSKDQSGLGITIAGLIGSSGSGKLCGIFVRHVTPGSAADQDGRIKPNDRIVEVNGQSLEGFSNAQAVEVLKSTGQTVSLKLARPKHGATHLAELQRSLAENTDPKILLDEDLVLRNYWCQALGLQSCEIIIAHILKPKEKGSLGVSLKGTVDVEDDGSEVRPHHYIQEIQPEGPIGHNGCIQEGDELLEVNGQRLLGINYKDVRKILSNLPQTVTLVCSRRTDDGHFLKDTPVFRAKSDVNLSFEKSEVRPRCRSVASLTTLALWSNNITEVDLIKGEKGLGFSVLDYQDPLNNVIIVVRSLVPGGVAQMDGRILPRDRLMYVNEISLENATLEDAVKALKGAPSGLVRIGLVKPISTDTSESSTDNLSSNEKCLSSTPISNKDSADILNTVSRETHTNASTTNLQSLELSPNIRDTTLGFSPVSAQSDSETTFNYSVSPKLQARQNFLFTAPKKVVVYRKLNESLGISIVGGKMEIFSTSRASPPLSPNSPISGIFVKHVLDSGPAAGLLKMGDRILEVDGKDIRFAAHDDAVETIKLAKSPVTFLVQSISDPNPDSNTDMDEKNEVLDTIEMISAAKMFSQPSIKIPSVTSDLDFIQNEIRNETSSSSSENDLTADSYQLYSMISSDQPMYIFIKKSRSI